MRVLWILYKPLGRAAEVIENTKSQSGTWVDAMISKLYASKDVSMDIGIACIAKKNIKLKDDKTNIIFYGLNSVKQVMGKYPRLSDISKWKIVIDDFEPDIIQVWGTEFSNGLSILKAAEDIPVLFFVQGIVGRITDYPLGLLKYSDVRKYLGPISLIKFAHFARTQRMLERQKKIEIEMVSKSAGIIVDNDWAASYYRVATNGVTCYDVPLPINDKFLNESLEKRRVKKDTIFAIDLCNPAKGNFQLIRALAIVKKTHPNVMLNIPGRLATKNPKIIFESPYFTYLKRLIKRLGLEDNVTFCGQLTTEEMKGHLQTCNVFVMPSSIENHSASLREAMYLGCPCVTALVGSVAEYVQHGENALTYRYGEEDILADNILRILEDDSFSKKLSENAYQSIRNKYPMNKVQERLYYAYSETMKKVNDKKDSEK